MNFLTADWFPLGTLINGACILAGGMLGLWMKKQVSEGMQLKLRYFLVLLTFVAAGTMMYGGLTKPVRIKGGATPAVTIADPSVPLEASPGLGRIASRMGIAFVALIAGALVGSLLGLQKQLDKLGAYARKRLSKPDEDGPGVSEGFIVCTILFCVGPMTLVGPIQDGLGESMAPLLLKSVMDGTATFAMVSRYGWGPILAVIPVVTIQGTVTLLAHSLQPLKEDPELLAAIGLAGGLMVLAIVLVILEVRKVPLADYLPALVLAPLMAHWLL